MFEMIYKYISVKCVNYVGAIFILLINLLICPRFIVLDDNFKNNL